MYSFVTVYCLIIATVLKPNIGSTVAFQRESNTVVEISNNVCKTLICNESANEILNNMDNSVDPCDDFYRFSCGGFLKKTSIPDGDDEVDYFTVLESKIMRQLRTTIEEPKSTDEPQYIRMLKNLYKSCMDEAGIERRGFEPLQEKLNMLGGWPVLQGQDWNETNFDWIDSTYKFRTVGYPTDYFLTLNIDVDLEDSTKQILKLDDPLLEISRAEMIAGIDSKNVQAYYKLMVDIAVMLGAPRDDAAVELEESLEFEMALAKIMLSNLELHNQTEFNNSMTVAELSKKYSSIPWKKYINSLLAPYVTVNDNETVIVTAPEHISKFVKLMDTTPNRVQANYMMWRAVKDSALYLNRKMVERVLKYMMELTGKTKPKPRWERCVRELQAYVPTQALYIKKYFHEATKSSTFEMITEIINQFKKLLKTADWMDDESKKNALDKATTVSFYVGYHDELSNDTLLEEAYKQLKVNDDNYFENRLTIRRYDMDETYSGLREPVDESDSFYYALTVNAFYYSLTNSILLPAGILQGIFFNDNRPKYMNYGAIGSIIGHEITHAFDDKEQYDRFEKLVNWMTPATKEEYHHKALCIIKQYSNFTIAETEKKLNGSHTQRENIADNNGFKIAYLAYTDWLKRHGKEQSLPGLEFNRHQMFWISAANSLCSKYRSKYIQAKIAEDTHSPYEFQILGSFRNLPEFAEDFKCPVGSKMNPENKCIFW